MQPCARVVLLACVLHTAAAGTPGAPRLVRAVGRVVLKPLTCLVDACCAPLVSIGERSKHRRRIRSRPRRIILVRHGQSVGNVDRMLYSSMADPSMGLTEAGFAQGREAGVALRAIVGDESCRFFYSPYVRTRQTLLAMLRAFPSDRPVQLTVEPRLREQDFGNFQDPTVMQRVMTDRKRFGRFFYRIPNGEAGTDVYDRVCDFWSGMLRSLDENGAPGSIRERVEHTSNVVLVTHGSRAGARTLGSRAGRPVPR